MNASEIYNNAIEKYYAAQSPSDKKHALNEFEIAAQMGLDLAMMRAGEMHFFGDGVKPSREKGIRWISKACKVAEHYNDLFIHNPRTGNFLNAKVFLNKFT